MNSYPYKHWLTSLVVGPLLMIIYEIIFDPGPMVGVVETYFLFLTFGLFFSVPVFLLYLLTFNQLTKKINSNLTIKTILNTVGVIGIIVTFLIIKGSMAMMLAISYSVTLIISSVFYRVRPKEINKQIE